MLNISHTVLVFVQSLWPFPAASPTWQPAEPPGSPWWPPSSAPVFPWRSWWSCCFPQRPSGSPHARAPSSLRGASAVQPPGTRGGQRALTMKLQGSFKCQKKFWFWRRKYVTRCQLVVVEATTTVLQMGQCSPLWPIWLDADKADSFTFRRSSAASSFFWISSKDGSRRCGMEVLSSGTPSKDGGLRMTSKAWPEARLFSSITSTSLMTHQPRSTASVGLDRYESPWPQ